MEKIPVHTIHSFGFPLPVVLVGAEVNEKPACLTAAWAMPVESSPPMLAVALAPHHTTLGIDKHNEFSINVPGKNLAAETDYCGIVSGSRTDKSTLFTYFRGELDHAPMIQECPVTIECRVIKTVKVNRHTLYIGEAVNVYADSGRVKNGRLHGPDLDALLLSGTDRNYYAPGDFLAKGWSIGKTLMEKHTDGGHDHDR